MNPEYVTNFVLDACDEADNFIRDTMARAPGALRWLVDHDVLTFLAPDFVKERLVELYLAIMRRAADLYRDAINLLRMMVKGLGQPTVLRAAADDLNANTTRTSTLADAMKPQSLLGLSSQDDWNSRATVPYGAGLTEQVESAAGIGEIMRGLEQTLRDMADSIESFYGELIWAAIGLVLAVVGLVMCFTGVLSIPGIILAAVGVLTAIISLIVVFTAAAGRNQASAEQLLASPRITWNQSAFAG